MRKIPKHFELTVPMPGREFGKPVNHGDLHISGVGYFWPGEEGNDRFDFDVDQVQLNGSDVTGIFKYLEGGVREFDFIDEACQAHMSYLFAEQLLHPVS